MRIGDTVYTVNAKTNTVDSWYFGGSMNTGRETLYRLESTVDGKHCYLPKRAVYISKLEALIIAETYRS